jgi:hypothetical protein
MTLLTNDWDWKPDSLICDVVIENRCEAGEVSYRAKKNGKLLFRGRDDFDFQSLILALRSKGHIA